VSLQIYIAGPFFNKQSKEILQAILDKLELLGHTCWAPMRDGITCPKNANAETRQKVFQLDCEQLHWAECVVALLDYPLPPYEQLMLKTQTPEGKIDFIDAHLPDPGTVFEIGFVNGLNESRKDPYRYIIGYSEISGFNLMVSEGCDCVVSSLAQLERIMEFVENKDYKSLSLLKLQCKQGDLNEL